MKRSDLIERLDLVGLESSRCSGGIRGGKSMHIEEWFHPSGLILTARDYDTVSRDLVITDDLIDQIIKSSASGNVSKLPFLALPQPKRESFDLLMVSSDRRKMIFSSSSNHANSLRYDSVKCRKTSCSRRSR